MRAYYYPDLTRISDAVDLINNSKDSPTALLLFSETHQQDENLTDNFFKRLNKPFFGAFFPGLIAGSKRKETGFIIILMPEPVITHAIPFGLSESDYDTLLDGFTADAGEEINTVFYFLDALGKGKPDSISYLYNYFGIGVNYLGGGAGSLSFVSFPCVFNQDGMYTNAALVGLSRMSVSLGSEHGWRPISEPMKVTKTSGNMLEELEWKPAFQVYKELVEKHSGAKFTHDNFFDIAKSYPFGMVKIDSEMVIRDPIQVVGDHIHVVDEIPEGEYISLMHGNMNSLLRGARAARNKSVSKFSGTEHGRVPFLFSIDCISRSLYMGEDFDRELEIIAGDNEVFGALTIGEIANSAELFLEIYNKTVVVCSW